MTTATATATAKPGWRGGMKAGREAAPDAVKNLAIDAGNREYFTGERQDYPGDDAVFARIFTPAEIADAQRRADNGIWCDGYPRNAAFLAPYYEAGYQEAIRRWIKRNGADEWNHGLDVGISDGEDGERYFDAPAPAND